MEISRVAGPRGPLLRTRPPRERLERYVIDGEAVTEAESRKPKSELAPA